MSAAAVGAIVPTRGGPFDVAAIKRANPLERVAHDYGLRLRPSGRGRLVALCPFHDDRRTPNLVLDLRDPDDEHFHCFAGHCRAHGDVIGFVMRIERLDFPGACAHLTGASSTGDIPPPRRRAVVPATPPERRWDRLTLAEQTVMNLAGAVYRRSLQDHAGALRYLHNRGVPDQLIARCALGWADGRALAATLGHREPALLAVAADLGLLRRAAGGGWRDTLAGRVVVPEVRGGHVLWFIGRGLAPDGGNRHADAKYLALPGERPALGQHWASGRPEAFICEGVFDWLAALARGLPAWSPCGTHFPAASLGFLARARRIYGVFDGDDAGRAASARFAAALGERYRAVTLPEGCDLSDVLRQPGGDATFNTLLATARDGP